MTVFADDDKTKLKHFREWDGDKLLNAREVTELTRLSRTQILNMAKRGEFPGQIRLSRIRYAWSLHEVLAWIEARKAERVVPFPKVDEEPTGAQLPDNQGQEGKAA